MRTTRHILTAFLIAALLSAGMPLFSPNDADRDLDVDLKDAILRVKDFAGTAEMAGSFKFEAETAITVLRHVAGLKVSIAPVKDTKSTAPSYGPNGWYLPVSQNISPCLEVSFLDWEQDFFPKSLSIEPPTPPPEPAC